HKNVWVKSDSGITQLRYKQLYKKMDRSVLNKNKSHFMKTKTISRNILFNQKIKLKGYINKRQRENHHSKLSKHIHFQPDL
ncbi:MAG: hypothetical protein ACI93S_000935, partial [Ancylomarina sp.]